MLRAWCLLVCGLVISVSLPTGATENGALLPTTPLAKQVNALNMLLSKSPAGTTMESRRKAGFVVRDRVSQFILDQIEAKPDITQTQFRTQLRAITCSEPYNQCDCDHPPYLFGWFGPKGTSQFVVAIS